MNNRIDFSKTIEFKRNIVEIIINFSLSLIITLILMITTYVLYKKNLLDNLPIVGFVFVIPFYICLYKAFKSIFLTIKLSKIYEKYDYYLVKIDIRKPVGVLSEKFIINFFIGNKKIVYVTDYYKRYNFIRGKNIIGYNSKNNDLIFIKNIDIE